MLNFPLALLLLLFFNIFQFSLTAEFDAAAGGGREEREGETFIQSSSSIKFDINDDGSKGSLLLETLPWGNGLSGASISADNTGAAAEDYDLLLTTTSPSIRYADASPQSQKGIPPSIYNNNHGCRAEVLPTNNSKRMKRQQQARDVKSGFCPNENILPSSVTTEREQKQQHDGEKNITPPEALFGGGRPRGGGRRGPGPAKPDTGVDRGDRLPKEDDDGPNAAANFIPTPNPNLCRDPNHPIPVCHKMVQSYFGDSEDTLYELPRCYPG